MGVRILKVKEIKVRQANLSLRIRILDEKKLEGFIELVLEWLWLRRTQVVDITNMRELKKNEKEN